MIPEFYEYLTQNYEKIISKIKVPEEKAKEVKEKWIERQPRDLEGRLAGIDSSWNLAKHAGFFFYLVNAVAVDQTGRYVVEPKLLADVQTADSISQEYRSIDYYLESIGMEYESELAQKAISSGYTALVDNSALAVIYDKRNQKVTALIEYVMSLINSEDIIFIAKSSESRRDIKGSVGDVYYYTKLTYKAGISKVSYDDHGVSFFYARIDDWAPVIRVEVPGKISEGEAFKIVDTLHSVSVNGYPYPLYLAHSISKITDEELSKAESLLGLSSEPYAREVLWE